MATYTIANYLASCRDETNGAKGSSNSLQSIAWKFDTDGIPIGVASEEVVSVSGKIHLGVRPTDYSVPVVGENGVLAIKYASPTGSGDGSEGSPYDLQVAFNSLVAGDFLWLRGGTYNPALGDSLYCDDIEGTVTNPIVIESFTDELAIIDGQNRTPADVTNGTYDNGQGMYVNSSNYISFRKFNITGMNRTGMLMYGSYNKIQGCEFHGNFLSGLSMEKGSTYGNDAYNEITDSKFYNNSDAGIYGDSPWNDGDNADGIALDIGDVYYIRYNEIYANSDDGVDCWYANDCEVEFNLIYDNGRGEIGNGNGVKLGGNENDDQVGMRNICNYNLIYDNKSAGISQNACTEPVMLNNTLYNNGIAQEVNGTEVEFHNNIASDNDSLGYNTGGADKTNNSWQIGDLTEDIAFYSTTEGTDGYMVPIDPVYQVIGVYADAVISPDGISYAMNFDSNQATQTVMAVPLTPFTIEEVADGLKYTYTDDRAGEQILYTSGNTGIPVAAIVGTDLILSSVSQISGEDVVERLSYKVFDGIHIPDMGSMNPSLPTDVPLWIIGDSTACDYEEASALQGWGTFLISDLLIDPARADNRARAGTSSKSFKPEVNDYASDEFWGDGSTLSFYGQKGVKQSILETDTSSGGYLLVCHVANDFYEDWDGYGDGSVKTVPEIGNELDIELMEYINFARSRNVTPIFITATSGMDAISQVSHDMISYRRAVAELDDTTPPPYEALIGLPADWIQTMRDMGVRENVLTLDLMTASANHYLNDFIDDQEVLDAYSQDGSDTTHTNEAGAKMLADLIKDLAADAGAIGFSEQFL